MALKKAREELPPRASTRSDQALAMNLWLGERPVAVTLGDDRRMPQLPVGECACGACRAAGMSDLPVRFY